MANKVRSCLLSYRARTIPKAKEGKTQDLTLSSQDLTLSSRSLVGHDLETFALLPNLEDLPGHAGLRLAAFSTRFSFGLFAGFFFVSFRLSIPLVISRSYKFE